MPIQHPAFPGTVEGWVYWLKRQNDSRVHTANYQWSHEVRLLLKHQAVRNEYSEGFMLAEMEHMISIKQVPFFRGH